MTYRVATHLKITFFISLVDTVMNILNNLNNNNNNRNNNNRNNNNNNRFESMNMNQRSFQNKMVNKDVCIYTLSEILRLGPYITDFGQ